MRACERRGWCCRDNYTNAGGLGGDLRRANWWRSCCSCDDCNIGSLNHGWLEVGAGGLGGDLRRANGWRRCCSCDNCNIGSLNRGEVCAGGLGGDLRRVNW